MKKTIFSLLSLSLLALPASAQESKEAQAAERAAEIQAMQKRLDAGNNTLGVRIESCEDFVLGDPIEATTDTETSDKASSDTQSGKNDVKRRTPAIFNPNAKKWVFSYMSKDGKKNDVRLSVAVYTRQNYKTEKVLLNCHPTVTSLFEAPTGGGAVDQDVKRIVDDNYMVVCPDYCGYGFSGYKQHPYLIHDVTARNCIDALKAALYFKETEINQKGSYDTYIVGYSQGGATALACAKYLESDACPQEDKDRIKLKETCCGDGPYSTVKTIRQYLEWGQEGKNLEYPCVLPLIVAAAIEAYGDGCMRTVKLEDYFSPEFKATGIIDKLKNKSLTTVDLNKDVMTLMNNHLLPTDVLSDKIINKVTGEFNDTTNEYKCLMRAMEMNDLTHGWVPQHKVTFFHLDNDGVVPYVNLDAIKNRLKVDAPDAVNIVTANEAWSDIKGIRFGKWIKGEGLPSPDQCNHSTGGTLFYAAYLFGDLLHDNDD